VSLDVDAICFDLDDTLCTYERTVEDVLALSFERTGIEPFFDGVTYRAYFDRFLEECDDADELRSHCFAEIATDRGRDPELGREVAATYAEARDQTRVEPKPGAIETVRTLAEEYPLALITNGDRSMQAGKLEGIGLTDAFDVTVFAGDEVSAKPEAEPFERAILALDVDPERAVHVGNSLDSDVAGAHGYGLRTIWTPATHDLPEGVSDAASVHAEHPDVDPTPDHVLPGVQSLPGTLGLEG
jgi:putative hydrolase of the HAD superfamily